MACGVKVTEHALSCEKSVGRRPGHGAAQHGHRVSDVGASVSGGVQEGPDQALIGPQQDGIDRRDVLLERGRALSVQKPTLPSWPACQSMISAQELMRHRVYVE